VSVLASDLASTASQPTEPEVRDAGSVYTGGCNSVTLTLSIYEIEPLRTTPTGIPVRTVKCLRREGVNGSQTVWVDVWLWRGMAQLADRLRKGQEITVTGRIAGLRAWTNGDQMPAATIIVSAQGLVAGGAVRHDGHQAGARRRPSPRPSV
jgi:hypothetical protein